MTGHNTLRLCPAAMAEAMQYWASENLNKYGKEPARVTGVTWNGVDEVFEVGLTTDPAAGALRVVPL